MAGPVAGRSVSSEVVKLGFYLRVPKYDGTVKLKPVELGAIVNMVVDPVSPSMKLGNPNWTLLLVPLAAANTVQTASLLFQKSP